jgi:tRNA 2-selenouridine synthase
MALTLTALSDLADAGFDTVIDVRSPAEYAEDHLPGAISLPVLSNEERARVGTIYKQDSPFRARKIGAALVARNAAAHLEGPLAGMAGGWRPLVYCWRGGQRSSAFATILEQVGWRAQTVAGGYRAYRRLVTGLLYDGTLGHRLAVLDGNTGTAKTEILALLDTRGVQVIDLEALAGHRGSVFGHRPGGQPSQKTFESSLAAALVRADPARPLVVEAESSRIGALTLPPALWSAMGRAPRIALRAAPGDRAAYLVRAYADMLEDPAQLAATLNSLRPLQGHALVEAWQALARAGDWHGLARELTERHYDPRYLKSRVRGAAPAATLDIALDSRGLDTAAGAIEAALTRLFSGS